MKILFVFSMTHCCENAFVEKKENFLNSRKNLYTQPNRLPVANWPELQIAAFLLWQIGNWAVLLWVCKCGENFMYIIYFIYSPHCSPIFVLTILRNNTQNKKTFLCVFLLLLMLLLLFFIVFVPGWVVGKFILLAFFLHLLRHCVCVCVFFKMSCNNIFLIQEEERQFPSHMVGFRMLEIKFK